MYASLTELNVLAAGEAASAVDGAQALATLNRLIDQWAAEQLMIYSITRTTWAIVSGTGTYLVGTGAAVNIARPVFVQTVRFQDTSTDPDTEYPLSALTDDGYQGLVLKALTSVLPTSYYYNPTYPSGTLTFWPVPTSSTLQGVIYASTAVTQFAGLTTTVSLPPGYERMIVKNLAVELAPSYPPLKVPDLLMRQAMESKATVKRANIRPADLHSDLSALIQGSSGRYGYNISTDS